MIQATRPRTLEDLIARAEISDVVHRYATGVDGRDWPLLRTVFAEEVLFDVRSWVGGGPQLMRADDWVPWVAGVLSGFDATRHYSSNHVHRIEGDEATCVSNMVARHYLVEGEARAMHTSFGYYTHRLKRSPDGWVIHGHQLIITADMGERALHERARARWAARNAK
jgi:3-phenylpropionate/cinnamic acid dioxygenase small subunit